jgi:hypothetical protein
MARRKVLFDHEDVPEEVRKVACKMYKDGHRHSDILQRLGIAPDERHELIGSWLNCQETPQITCGLSYS